MADKTPIDSTATKLLLEADAKAELLLGIVRMVVAGSIAVALAVGLNQPNRPESEFLDKQGYFASVGMVSYFLVGLAAFLLVKTGKYKPWMAWVIAFFDVMLITINVWLSINFSGLSTQYALVFPSAFMLPLILTFGALRFRPDIQISMTVLVCVFAVAIIFSNPFFETPDENILTQMALTHALPPNMIRLWLLFSTGIIIALAVWRARDLLRRITQATEQRLNLTRFLPHTVVQELDDVAMGNLRQGQQLPLAMMFLDVRGFTQMSEVMKPEETSVFLTEYRSLITDIVEDKAGIVDKFIGDGALVIFGMASSPQESAKASLEAAVELNSRFEKWNLDRKLNDQDTFKVGIGLHFGNVFLGAIGDDRRLEFTVLGDNVNIAARIEQMTKTENYEVLASQDLINAAGENAIDGWVELGEKSIRGRSGGIKLWGHAS